MSNPFAKTFEELRSPFLQEKMAKKDYDGDGKIESGTDEYKGSVDKAIKKKMGKKVTEHHQKDADGNVVEHGDGTPASLDEISNRTMRNYIIKGTKDVAKRASDPDSDSGPKYGKKMKRMDGIFKAADKLAKKGSSDARMKEEVEQEEISYTAAYLPSNVDEEQIVETPKGDVGKDRATKVKDRKARSFGGKDTYGAKYNAPDRRGIHDDNRGVKKDKGHVNRANGKYSKFNDNRKGGAHWYNQGQGLAGTKKHGKTDYDEPSRKKMKKESETYTSPSVQEGAPYTVNIADKTGNTPAYQNFKKGMLNRLTGKPLYKAGVGLDKAHYEPAPVKAPHFSDWKEEMHWEALKGKKLDIDDSGNVKNKIEINPEIKTEAAKAEVKKPKKAQDAGARAKRMLQRREYAAKISGSEDRVPDDLRDSVQYDENLDNIKTAVSGAMKKVGRGLKTFINKPVMPNYPTKKQYQDSIKQGTSNQYMSYEPEGEMIDEMGKKFGTLGNTLGDASDKVMKKLKDGTPVKKIDKKIKKLNMGENFMRDKKYVDRYKKSGGYLNSPARKKADAEHAKNNPKRKPFEPIKRGTMFGNKLNDEVQYEAKDKKGSGSGTKDACYHKVKSRYSVWPSAYASGALVKCRKKGAKNWGNSSKKEEVNWDFEMKSFGAYAAECWKTHKQVGTKMKGGKVVPNCVPKNEDFVGEEGINKDPAFDIMRPGGANSPFNADGTPKKKSLNKVRGTAFK